MSALTRADLARLDTLAGRVEEFAASTPRPKIIRAAGLLRQEYDAQAPPQAATREITAEEVEQVRAVWDEVHKHRYDDAAARARYREAALRYFAELDTAGVSMADIARAMPASRQRASELVREAHLLPAEVPADA